jgi:hypothetical protein
MAPTRLRRSAAALALGLLPLPGLGGARAQEIEAARLERHVHFLASDRMRGRETGSPENDLAACYLAGVLEGIGLAPAGDDGSFLQAVPLVASGLVREPRLVLLGATGERRELSYGVDFSVQGGGQRSGSLRLLRVDAAEELPAQADPGLALLLAGSRAEVRKWLEDSGHGLGEAFGALLVRGSARAGTRSFQPSRQVGPADLARRAGAPTVVLNGEARELLLQGGLHGIELEVEPLHEPFEAFNVLGRIDGVGSPGRPDLAEEAIVLSAHFDHIGVAPPPKGLTPEELAGLDLVYNGADDDASGVAFVLELARALAAGPPPARTLLFLLATGEEKGLLGTNHYLERPAVPLERTVLNLNFEMVGRPDALVGGAGRLWLTGHERSNLLEAAVQQEIPLSPDLRPDQRFFQRSDNFAFALRGIVAQTLSSYDLHRDYHQVGDRPERLDYGHMAKGAQSALELTRLVARGELDPVWLEGQRPVPRGR